VKAVGRPEIDLENPGSASAVLATEKPDVVINAAAYTAVDQAEGIASGLSGSMQPPPAKSPRPRI
jgi:dTDP-4-dehydrorhamnose reductase